MKTIKFTKVARGWYATEDGQWAVIYDGYPVSQSLAADAQYEGFIGGEWGLVHDSRGRLREDAGIGNNLDWFTTKKAAVEAAQRRAA